MNIEGFSSLYLPGTSIKCYGREFKWWPSDTEEKYDPINNPYGPNDITYKFNSHGFRCDEFDINSKKRILFLGCSFTFGIGVPLEHTWPYILLNLIKSATNLDIPYWNLAAPGCGLDVQTRLYYHYGIKLKPSLVFSYFPDYRRELYYDDESTTSNFLASHPRNNFKNKLYLLDQRIIKYETEKNLCFLDTMLKLNNAKMIYGTWAKNLYPIHKEIQTFHNFNIIHDRKARDKSHPGHAAHIKFAKEIFETYKDTIIEILKD